MENSYRSCVFSLTSEGYDPSEASRACAMAFWQEFGEMPHPGTSQTSDVSGKALQIAGALCELDEPAVESEPASLCSLSLFSDQGECKTFLREATVLYPGKFNGFNFTPQIIDQVLASFDPSDPPPIQLDHSRLASDTVGRVRGLRKFDQSLVALMEFIGEDNIAKVESGLWTKVSGGFMVSKPAKLYELSVTPFPAVGGAKIKRKERKKMQIDHETVNELNEVATGATIETTIEPAPEVAANTESAVLTELENLRLQNQKLMEENARKDAAIRLKEDTDIVQILTSAGRSVPALRDKEVDFLQSLSLAQRDAYISLRESLPLAWEGEGRVTQMTSPEQSEEAFAKTEAIRLIKKMKEGIK